MTGERMLRRVGSSKLSVEPRLTRLGSMSSHPSRLSSTASKDPPPRSAWYLDSGVGVGSSEGDDLQRILSSSAPKRQAWLAADWWDEDDDKAAAEPTAQDKEELRQTRALAERLHALNKLHLLRTLRQEKDVLVQALLHSERRPLEPSETIAIRDRLAQMRQQLLAMS